MFGALYYLFWYLRNIIGQIFCILGRTHAPTAKNELYVMVTSVQLIFYICVCKRALGLHVKVSLETSLFRDIAKLNTCPCGPLSQGSHL